MTKVWAVAIVLGVVLMGTDTNAKPSSDEEVWQEFVQWLPSVPPSENPKPIFDGYRAHLVARGIPKEESDRRLSVVLNAMRTRTDGWRVMFNKIYTSKTAGFSTSPTGLLVSAVEDRKAGRALDVGMGQGRNSVFLAMKGWQVTGFDISDEGMKIAQQNAKKAGVSITTVEASIAGFDFGEAQWDLIVITYEPAPVTTPSYVQKLKRALRPGGLVVIESFASDEDSKMRRPVDIDPARLLGAFGEFRILHFEDVNARPEWTHDVTRLARLVAERR